MDEITFKSNNETSTRILIKVILTSLLLVLVWQISSILILIFLASILAVSLMPLLERLQRIGVKRNLGVILIALALMGLLVAFIMVLVPAIYDQITVLIKGLPDLRTSILAQIPGSNSFKSTLSHILNNPKIPEPAVLLANSMLILNSVVGGFAELLLILIFTLYLLSDGEKAFQWIGDFFSSKNRAKLRQTASETSIVVYGYVRGQLITSLISFIYAFIILSAFKVPGPLILASLAGIFDVLPILGFFISVIPAILLALTVSHNTGLQIFGLYVLYHAIENYLIVPFVYGSSLKVSSLVVLIALLVAGSLGGVLAAIAILPVVASYPIIERIWLAQYLGRDVVEKHTEESLMEEAEKS